MKNLFLSITILLFYVGNGFGQSTAELIYEIFQTSCTFSSCHSSNGASLGLDLEGSGANPMMEVYNNIVNVTPNTAHAANQDNMLIKPGDPARSFLFRKIQNGLDPTLSLHPSEGSSMPIAGNPLDEEDIELVRQWILYGAPANSEVIDVALIDDFYNNNGIQSVPNPPAMPDPSEGFQLHLGPFFIEPGGEAEVFLKHDLMLDEDIEVTAVETVMGIQSHHFILNKFLTEETEICGIQLNNSGPESFPEGFRNVNNSSHFSSLYQVGAQETGTLKLPYKTAFSWEAGTIIDLNSHYINANQNQVLAAELFVNVYTQPAGIAKQEMQSLMLPETDIFLPPDGQEYTISQTIPVGLCYPNGLYLWSVSSHTHELGQDFDIYKTDISGNNVEHLYDGSCFQDGVPGCDTELYDYQHPPARVFDDYYRLNGFDGLKQEATYINDTDEAVTFGLTSEDEMLIMFLFFLEDTAGTINLAPIAFDDSASTNQDISVTINVLANDNDIDGVALNGIGSEPSNGTTTINTDGSIVYTPTPGFFGADMFTYIICDSTSSPLCDTATVNINVAAPTSIFSQNFRLASVYPNPTNGKITVAGSAVLVNSIDLYSIQGKQIKAIPFQQTNGNIAVDLKSSNIQNGIYWLMITHEDNSQTIAKVIYAD